MNPIEYLNLIQGTTKFRYKYCFFLVKWKLNVLMAPREAASINIINL
jgi:hypothetical protein